MAAPFPGPCFFSIHQRDTLKTYHHYVLVSCALSRVHGLAAVLASEPVKSVTDLCEFDQLLLIYVVRL